MSSPSPSWQRPAAPYGPPQPPQPPKSPRIKQGLIYACTAITCLGIGAAMGGTSNNSDTKATPIPTVTVTATAAAAGHAVKPAPTTTTTAATAGPNPASPQASTVPGDGTYLVGTDMQPGTWKTAGTSGIGCYWERDKDSSGDFSSIITNDTTTGSAIVTVNKGETFKTSGCQDWARVG